MGEETAMAAVLSSDAAAELMCAAGFAAFRWEIGSDRLSLGPGAATLLKLKAIDLPGTGRALRRLMTAETLAARGMAFPLPALDGDLGPVRRYRSGFAIRPDVIGTELPVWIEDAGTWELDETGQPIGVTGVLRRVEDLGGSGVAPDHIGTIDPLTGTLSRTSLLAALGTTIDRYVRDQRGSGAFLSIAIDDLAGINLNFGYDVADRIIMTVAQRIRRDMRQVDLLGRLSGHKFGALLHECDEAALAVAAARFREAVESVVVATPQTNLNVSISIGGVVFPRHARDVEQALTRAEEALGMAKQRGRGGFEFYQPSPERDALRRRNFDLAAAITSGLASHRFVLAYQPIVEAGSGRLIHYEALCRLVREDGSVVSAGPLIAAAERIGLMRRIDIRVLDLALADLAAESDLKLSVNVSVESAREPAWIERLLAAVTSDRSIPGRLTIEITETAAMRNVAEMAALTGMLRDLGCHIAIDDFGAGYTSFVLLRDIEVDWVKIDGSYIADIAEDPDSAIFVRALVTLADHFGIRSVAEWVKDDVSAQILRGIGIDAFQGRYAGDPMLRITPAVRAALGATEIRAADGAGTGYPPFVGLLEGPIVATQVGLSPRTRRAKAKRSGRKAFTEGS